LAPSNSPDQAEAGVRPSESGEGNNSGDVMHITPKILTKTCLIACLGLLPLALGCQKEEEPPPLPTSKPAPTPTAVPLVVEEEDAGAEKEEPKKTGTGGARRGALSACCAALRQNAANLSEPAKGHTLTAAAACESANSAGSPAGVFMGTLSALLRGAPLPSACR
jgi:hypothetical protein